MTTEPIYPALARLVADSNGSKHHLAERAELFDAERRAPLQRQFNELAVEAAQGDVCSIQCTHASCIRSHKILALWERMKS